MNKNGKLSKKQVDVLSIDMTEMYIKDTNKPEAMMKVFNIPSQLAEFFQRFTLQASSVSWLVILGVADGETVPVPQYLLQEYFI